MRNRAVRLLQEFFAHDDARERRAVFNTAFTEVNPDPRPQIEFRGAPAAFANEADDRLLNFGCAARGRHYLSLLLAAMCEARGRQSDPDFYQLQRELDSQCALPTRQEELQHLNRLLREAEAKACLYSPLRAIVQQSHSKA